MHPPFGPTKKAAALAAAFLLNLFSFFDTSSFTRKVAQIIEFCTTDNTLAENVDLLDAREMYREHTLNADTVGDAANRERLTDTRALTADDDALEHLDTLPGTLDDLCMNAARGTGSQIRDIRSTLLLFLGYDDVHFFPP